MGAEDATAWSTTDHEGVGHRGCAGLRRKCDALRRNGNIYAGDDDGRKAADLILATLPATEPTEFYRA